MNAQNLTLGDGVIATAVERPSSVEELQELVRRYAGSSTPLYPQGGQTALEFGGVPRTAGVAVSTTALGRVIDYPAADMTITVEAGITMAELAGILDREGQRLTIDPPQTDRATVGGVYATNASGPRRYGVGRPRDQIIGVSFVTANGEVVKGGGRVVKNVAGYDFPRLITGSMGTLGVISQLTLKVRPKPETSALVWVLLDDIDAVSVALDSLNLSKTRPMAIELLNRPGSIAVGQGIGLPTEANWALAVGYEDNAVAVDWQVTQLLDEVGSHKAFRVDQGQTSALWSALMESPASGRSMLGFEAHVPPSNCAAFAAEVDAGLWSLQAHAGSGILRGKILEPIEQEAAVAEVHKLRSLAVGFGGALILPECPTEWKAELKVWGYPRPDWVWCERLKQTFDPAGILNPGRFIGSI